MHFGGCPGLQGSTTQHGNCSLRTDELIDSIAFYHFV